MKTFTSAEASRYVRILEDEKRTLLERERRRKSYVAAADDEDPDIPAYDYAATRARVAEIDETVCKLRHGMHAHNAQTMLPELGITVDEALIRLAQLSSERRIVDNMRDVEQRVRVDHDHYFRSSTEQAQEVVEYQYANYDVAQAERDYQELYRRIIELQGAIDYSNQTTQFEVDI